MSARALRLLRHSSTPSRGWTPPAPVVPSFTGVNGAFVQQLNAQEQADMAPTAAALAAYAATCQDLAKVATAWQRFSTTELIAINSALKSHGRPAVAVPAGAMRAPVCR